MKKLFTIIACLITLLSYSQDYVFNTTDFICQYKDSSLHKRILEGALKKIVIRPSSSQIFLYLKYGVDMYIDMKYGMYKGNDGMILLNYNYIDQEHINKLNSLYTEAYKKYISAGDIYYEFPKGFIVIKDKYIVVAYDERYNGEMYFYNRAMQ